VALKKVAERIRIISIINGSKRIILKSNVFPVIVVNSHITYSIHSSYIFHEQTNRSKHLSSYLCLVLVQSLSTWQQHQEDAWLANEVRTAQNCTLNTRTLRYFKNDSFRHENQMSAVSYNTLLSSHIVFYSQ
jgi:hypothetical protein